jgi:micrococcal nuclease
MSSDYWSSWAAMDAIVREDADVLHSIFFVRINGHYGSGVEHLHVTRFRGTGSVMIDEKGTKLGYSKTGDLDAALVALIIDGTSYPKNRFSPDVRVAAEAEEMHADESRDAEMRILWRIVADNGRAIFEDDLDDESEDEDEEDAERREATPQRPWVHADDWVFAVLVFDPALMHSQSKDNVYIEVIPLHLGRRQRGRRTDEHHHLHHFQKRYMVKYRTPRDPYHPTGWQVRLMFHAEKKTAAEWAALSSPDERETRDFAKTLRSIMPPGTPVQVADQVQSDADGGFLDQVRGGAFRLKTAVRPVTTERVERVIDGDTLVLKSGERVRLYGIDAPEYDRKEARKDQTYGPEARDALNTKIARLSPRYRIHIVRRNHGKPDRYGRTLATIYAPGGPGNEGAAMRDLNLELIQEGFAWYYPIDDGALTDMAARYETAEARARTNGVGLWQFERPMRPHDFRRAMREEQQRKKKQRQSASFLSGTTLGMIQSSAGILAAEADALAEAAAAAERPSSEPTEVLGAEPLPFEGAPSVRSMEDYAAYHSERAVLW